MSACVLEVAGLPADQAEALLWRLVDFTHPLGDGHQEIRWEIRRGAVTHPPTARLADWELAQLWYLPDTSFDRAGFERDRPLAAPAPAVRSGGLSLIVAESRGRPLAIPVDTLARHLAVLGATGSGKSTLLLNLTLAAIDANVGATVIDPHGDLVADILGRVPSAAAGRIHVLRLADRDHPRGFNFLERRSPGEAQLVASEFVYMIEDLWPRFSGPKMQHYLRNALLTLLADERPQTILELIRVLTDDAFRAPFVKRPGRPDAQGVLGHCSGREAASATATRRSRRSSTSSARSSRTTRSARWWGRGHPRSDRGNSWIAARSSSSTCRVSAATTRTCSGRCSSAATTSTRSAGRGSPREARRQHLLIVDEAQRFATRALENISVEGRKFGLALTLASQSLGGLGERLSRTILTNAASIALLAPGSEDVRGLARLFAPVTAEQLSALRAFEVVMRMPGRDGRPTVAGGILLPPGVADPAVAAATIAASDAQDARPLDEVRAEVDRRAAVGPPDAAKGQPPARAQGPGPAMTRDCRRRGVPGGAPEGRPATVPRRAVVLVLAPRSTGLLP